MNPFLRLFYRFSKIIKSHYKPINESASSYQKSSQSGGVVIKFSGHTAASIKMTCYTIFLFIACCLVISFCNLPVLPFDANFAKFPFRNASLPLRLRVDDLVRR